MIDQNEQSQGTLKKQRKPFVMSPVHLFTNPEIPALAVKLWLVLDSKPDGWRFFWSEILKHFYEGRNAVKKSMKTLEKFGYVKRKKAKKGNIFCGMDIEVFYDPSLPFDQENQGSARVTENGSSDNELPENGSTETRTSENGCTKKNKSKSDLLKKDLSYSSSNPPSKEFFEEIKKKKNFRSSVDDYISNRIRLDGWGKVKGEKAFEADYDFWEQGYCKKNPVARESLATDRKIGVVESEEIKQIRSAIKFHLGYNNKQDACHLFANAVIEKVEDGFKVIVSNNKALDYQGILSEINAKIEVR